MFNLNDANFGGGITVFNNGNAGKVEGVKMSVTKRSVEDPDNSPNYKLVFTDNAGGVINTGFYYHENNNSKTEKQNNDAATWLVSRVHSAAKAVVPANFVFPEVKTAKEAVDSLFKIIKDNCEGKLVNVYVTYGTVSKPSKYLTTRYFNFVEAADTPANQTRLKPSNNDQMIKLEADAPSEGQITQEPVKSSW